HPLHVGMPATWPDAEARAALREADLVLSLDWVDLAGTLRAAFNGADPGARIIHASLDQHLHRGWSMDYQGLPCVDMLLAAEPDTVARALLEALQQRPQTSGRGEARTFAIGAVPAGPLGLRHLAYGLRRALDGREVSLLHLPLAWDGALWPLRGPPGQRGRDGGAGVGAGPGICVGAALALRGSGRLPVGICGDGDFLMGATALWTAVLYRIPLLLVIANNRSFHNDEVHQERVARTRG